MVTLKQVGGGGGGGGGNECTNKLYINSPLNACEISDCHMVVPIYIISKIVVALCNQLVTTDFIHVAAINYTNTLLHKTGFLYQFHSINSERSTKNRA
jgi:hypothetical protein